MMKIPPNQWIDLQQQQEFLERIGNLLAAEPRRCLLRDTGETGAWQDAEPGVPQNGFSKPVCYFWLEKPA